MVGGRDVSKDSGRLKGAIGGQEKLLDLWYERGKG